LSVGGQPSTPRRMAMSNASGDLAGGVGGVGVGAPAPVDQDIKTVEYVLVDAVEASLAPTHSRLLPFISLRH
jgi:hypothetical protein